VSTGTTAGALTISPDGQTLYTGDPITAYDVASGDVIWEKPALYSPLDLNAAGSLLALRGGGDLKDVLLVDAATGETVDALRGHRDLVRDIRFSPDGLLVGAAPGDYELIVWETATGRVLERWHTFNDWGVGFSPDSDLVYGGGSDGSMLRTWDLSMKGTYVKRTTNVRDTELFAHADISPDGRQVAYTWRDDQDRGWVRFVDTATGDATSPARFPVWEGLFWFHAVDAWHPDGGHYVGYSCDGAEPCAAPAT
jgi:WD40 repeat protein